MASGSIMSSAAGKPITDVVLIDNLPKEINAMKINDDKEGKEMEAAVVDGNGTETGHIIVTTIGGKNGQPKQTISYMAERVVGQGSFGIVFQAKCLETGETVAIKKVLQDKRYKNRELQTMRLLDHPSIVSLKHCFFSTTEKDELYLNLVLEFVPETLYRVLRHYSKANQRMPIIYVKLYTYQIFRALAYIHGIGVCHRDIKPQNLLVNPHTHQLKLCDFGSAKVLVKGDTDRTCPYIDRQYSCTKNGRDDSDYLHWEWRPDDCILPRFDPTIALRKLQGKRIMFVGDSIQRNMWESFVCLVQSVIPEGEKSMKLGQVYSVFKAKEYNASIEFYWAPFLVESNTDIHIKADSKQRIIKVDSITERAKQWLGVDYLVFNTYVWWMSGLKAKALWGEFANGEEGYEEFDTPIPYKLALRTWANWIDSTIDTNKTKVFFTTMSPTHQRNEDWGNMNGTRCFNETRPVMKKGHWGVGSNKDLMKAVVDVIGRMKVAVTVLNITQLSEYRIDGHASVYGELGGKLLTDKQKAEPSHFADCIHWCLPGVPDTWNRMLYAYL